MFHTVIIPSAKRPQMLHEIVASLLQQETPADQILITVADPSYVLPEEVLQNHWLLVTRNNLINFLLLDQKIDRLGRLKGNLIAFSMILHGQIEPEYIEKL